MSNLNGIPSADYFETTLANTWNWTTGTVYVDEVPSASMPVGEYSYIVVNPWDSNMQVAKIDGWDSDNRTFNVTDVVIDSGAWTQYTAKTHPLGAKVRFSNNYAFWKDIQTAVNTKADDSDISTVWKSNDYNDLDNIPTFAPVATSNDYNDLDNLPTPVSIDWWDDILQLTWSNVLSATVSASYDSWTKKITLYGANSAVLSEIDCTAFIKDWMIQDVKIVTDPVGYAPWKYLEFDFNTDSGVTDIYIALSDLAVYTAWEWISISSNAVSVVAATASTLWWIKVGSWLTINSGTLSADSQTDENYTTAEKTKLSWIESGAEVNDIEKVQVNWTDLPISSKTVNVKIKTLNWEAIAWEWDIDIMARHYTAWTWISIDASDEISISSTYQTIISNKANSADLATVATTWSYNNLSDTPTIPANTSDLNNDSWFITSSDLSWYQTTANMVTNLTSPDNDHYPTAKAVADAISGAGAWDMLASVYDPNWVWADAFDMDNMADWTNNHYITTAQQTVLNNTSGTNTWDQSASDFDIKDLTDSTNLMSTWSGKQDALSTQTAYTSQWSATKVPQITTNNLWQVTSITEVTITQPDISGLTTWAASSTDWHLAVFDGVTWKVIKDWWAVPTWFSPANAWTTDQVLTKTAWWYEWQSPAASGTIMSETDYWQITPTNDFLYFTY